MNHRFVFLILVCLGWSSSGLADESRQQTIELEVAVREKVSMNHLLFLPEGYEEKASWPLLIFLHGAGERGDDLTLVKKHGPPKLVESRPGDFPFIIVSPQCAARRWWNPEAVKALVDKITAEYKVDQDRIYLTGLSMGGFGTWTTAIAYPDLFAAIAPICGGGEPEQAEKIAHLPAWVFHGAKDSVVPLKRSEEMVQALREKGSDVKFTVYPDAEHDSWTETYDNPELYKWLLQHTRRQARADQ